jgi:hypothetical protein
MPGSPAGRRRTVIRESLNRELLNRNQAALCFSRCNDSRFNDSNEMKWIFKWMFRLFLLAVVLVVVIFSCRSIPFCACSLSTTSARRPAWTRKSAAFNSDLPEPTIEIKDLKIYNPPSFGGTLFLDIPEIHAEYDRAALARREFHLTLLRFNLGELDIVKNQGTDEYFFARHCLCPKKSGRRPNRRNEFQRANGLRIQGIDV